MLPLLRKLKNWWIKQSIVSRSLWSVLFLGWLVLLYLTIRPLGTAVYSAADLSGNYFIHKLAPAERWATSSDGLMMIGQPSYFFLRPTRPFRQAEITVTWQPRSADTYLEAGILMDKANWQYQAKPLNQPGLNNLTWPSIASGSYHLWQKQPVYSTWQQFIANPPTSSQLAVYNWSPSSSSPVKLAGYQPSSIWQDIPGQWRGVQQIITYLAEDEPVAWRLAITSDAFKTLTSAERQVEVNITNNSNQRLWSGQQQLENDRLDWEITAGPWPAGAYRLEIKASPQLLTSLASKQTVFGWQGQAWPVAQAGFKWQLWTDARRLIAQTIQPASRQVIQVGPQALDIAKTYQQYQLDLNSTSTAISLSGGDIQLAGNGIFSLTPNIFNPQQHRVDQLSSQQLAGFDFIAADYQPPVCTQQTCQATAKLSLIGADWQPGAGYKIMLAADNSQLSSTSPLIIQNIQVKLSGQTLGQFISSLPGRLWNKLKKQL